VEAKIAAGGHRSKSLAISVLKGIMEKPWLVVFGEMVSKEWHTWP